ncbi:hypothetical protein H310_14864 [Aphanomyces invadans]|uniref:NADP-dependent oxidoreductase domain-containing protein n=1 Tax=Aphanomyces invadans TaxID=157072 RepID=A0A024T8M5_9STRA|nr:hypothetical protein H310_14864 [Aphanomyces invadans]ETV90339.1 hypothetical protein H310_14864 [Aphanomyces invadans]|eukprot:XP_008881030.1 hypothetical protein H310_14864 [Aphanomyces invadans]
MTVPMPKIMYGTAWKKERTAELVIQAVEAGFRGIDTACQPKHYFEKGVGDALAQLYASGIVTRDQIFLQTKFTSLNGQDTNQPLPYDPNVSLGEQVHQSFLTSMRNLQTNYVDSLVLHGPLSTHEKTMEVWRAMEQLYHDGKARRIGISNMYSPDDFIRLFHAATVAPSVLQNRFYGETGHDTQLRQFCRENNVQYQSFWTLTGNSRQVRSGEVSAIATRLGVTPEQVWYRFVMALGIVPLSGTTSKHHMVEDLAVEHLSLSKEDVATLARLIGDDV